MEAKKLRILHISDIHYRFAPDPNSSRAIKIRIETPRRARVHEGEAWRQNITDILTTGPIDIVCLTGDIADWGDSNEYKKATIFVEQLLKQLKLPKTRLFMIPGNHDVARGSIEDPGHLAWRGLRNQSIPRTEISEWMAGGSPPKDVDPSWREAVLERQGAFWRWVEQLGRAALLPRNSPHRRLGYQINLANELDLPGPFWILGLDTAWLAGDDNDAGKLLMTKEQVLLLGTDEAGQPLTGFRLALGHHPLADLGDSQEARQLLSDYADLYLHGHQHEPISTISSHPDRHLIELAAGCVFEGSRTDEHPNGIQVITVHIDAACRPREAELHFRSWSSRGAHWHDDASVYRSATNGRVTLRWPATSSAQSLSSLRASPTEGQLDHLLATLDEANRKLERATKSEARRLRQDLEQRVPLLVGACEVQSGDKGGLETTPAREAMTLEPREAYLRGRPMRISNVRQDVLEPYHHLPIEDHPEAGADIVDEAQSIAADVLRIAPEHAKKLESITLHARDRGVMPAKKVSRAERLQNIMDRLAEDPSFYTFLSDPDDDRIDIIRKHFPTLHLVLTVEHPEWLAADSKLAAKLSRFYRDYYRINPEDATR